MTTDELSILERLQRVVSGGQYLGAVAETEIAAAEEALGVRFPRSYRVFLRHFGAAWLPSSYEIAGVGIKRCTDSTPPRWEHVGDATVQMRRASRGLIPRDYISFSDDGGDYKFCLATDRFDTNEESPVVVLGPGRDGVVISASFVVFVEDAVAGRLDY